MHVVESNPAQSAPQQGHPDGGQPRLVAVEEIVRKIAPLTTLSVEQLRVIVEKYDVDRIGGLNIEQWLLFCSENRHLLASLGEEMFDFESLGEYTVVTVNHGPHASGREGPKGFLQRCVGFIEGFAAGGIAGAVSKTVIAPGDRVKIIFQVDSRRRFTLMEAVRLGVHTVREFGFTGLWIGNGATMLRVVPYAAITYVSFDYYRAGFNRVFDIKREDEHMAVVVRFISGSLAGATSTTATYPLDLMRARFAARSGGGKTHLPSYRAAFQEATARHGVLSLYGGLFPTLVGIVPYAGCSFAIFETLKQYIVRAYGLHSDKDIATWQRLIAGALAGLLAQSATYPLDIVRRRMQVTPRRYKGVVGALRTIYREEGLRQGLYKGLAMNWIKGPIATATSFTVNDLVKRRTRRYHETHLSVERRGPSVNLAEAFVCGGLAAGLAKLSTMPFSRLQIIYQMGLGPGEKASPRISLRRLFSIVKGNPNLWSSGHVTMVRVVPYGALTYGFFDLFQVIAERLLYTHKPTVATNFVAGGTAAMLATFLVYPLDLLRTRTAVMPTKDSRFNSYFWLFRAMARRHGLRSLWRGAYVSCMGVGLMSGLGFACYEYLAEELHCDTFGKRLAAGMAAGLGGQIAAYPFNIARLQRQMEAVAYTHVTTSRRRMSVLNPQVFASLYRRMPLSWALGSVTFGISFALNDTFRDLVLGTRQEILSSFIHPATDV